ncbi:MAG: ATP-binding protein [Atopobiaceae bacterium]|nr:ATP-binding protein [Atopobiaceae bacterium]
MQRSDENACLVIDELDSGIFEFLLGEILQVISDHSKGQLIFTAHNLRPLECLPSSCLVFTTTKPDNRYIKFRGSGASNNLRSQYLRAINLGGQKEQVYEPTSETEIGAAFYRACHS